MDDGWEVKYGLNPLDDVNDPNGAAHDLDGDGRSNYLEYQDGSDPSVATEVTRIVYEYDDAGQITKEKTQDEVETDVAVTQYQYDEVGRRWQERRWADPCGADDTNDMITLNSYYPRGDVNETVRKGINCTNPNSIEPNDLRTRNYYDSLGRLSQVKDANGDSTYYTYYTGGALYEVNDPLGNLTTNYYDDTGRLWKTVDGEGHYRVNTYDSFGRTTKQVACNSSGTKLMQTRYEYDDAGHITQRAVMADANSDQAVSTSVDMVIDYNYPASANGLLAYQRVWYDGGTAATTYYTYDGLGRRTKTIDPGGNVTGITYDAMGRATRREQDDDNPLAGEPNLVTATEYQYDSLGRLAKQIDAPNDANVTQERVYAYDALGSRVKETGPDGIESTYTYDALGRLT
ncbi:MAG: hypothetical protein ACYTEX_28280, partial [Planctomycetota bacterium]